MGSVWFTRTSPRSPPRSDLKPEDGIFHVCTNRSAGKRISRENWRAGDGGRCLCQECWDRIRSTLSWECKAVRRLVVEDVDASNASWLTGSA